MEKELKHYELMYIVPAKFAGEELESIKNKIGDLLTGNGAEITKTKEMGRLRLSYPVKGVFQGFYYVLEFNAEPAKVRKVESLLRIMPEVLRYLLINKRVLTERELEAESRLNAAVEAEMRAKGYREMPAEDVRPERAVRKETVAEMVAEQSAEPVIDPVSAEMNSDETVAEAVTEEVKEEKKTRKAKDKKISLDEMEGNLDDLISDDINKLL